MGHALETWSDATARYWALSGKVGQATLSGKFAKFRMKPVLGETFMPLGCVILEGGGNVELRAWKAFGQWINIIRRALPAPDPPEHARYAARKIVNFIQGKDTLSMKVMEDLDATERWSLVEECALLVLSFLKRAVSGAQFCMLTERVRRFAERALQKGLEYSRRATHKWLSQALKDIALLPDVALVSLGEIIRQCFVKLAISTQSLSQLLVLLGKKNGGSRTIAILHTTYRLTMRLVATHSSQWDVKFAGKWDSALKGNSALRAHVARAMGIELAHSEGQFVIHFLWDMRKFYDSIKAHLLIPQLVARGYPLEILVLGTLTHKSPRCLQVRNSFSKITTGCASSILAGCPQSCSWARGLLFEFVRALGYVVPGSVCEEHIDDLSQFVTNKSRMQLFHDAAKIGRAVKMGTAELGLTLSCKSTLLANDKSLGKLIVSHLENDGVPICLGTAATDLGIETTAGKRRCAASQWKRIWKGRRRAKRVHRLCKMNSEAHKLTMTGIHPVQIYGHTAQGASKAQVDAMCRNLKLGTVLGKTQACPITTVAWFFGVKRVPQTAARVEQISEWITMWRNSDVDTRRRIRRFWRKKAPMLAGNPRRWNQATGPISATICSLLEAGWKPSSPGFWLSPHGSATLDGALFNKAQIIDSFSSDMEMQTWKAAARHSSSSGLERGVITDFAKKARSQLIKEGHFTAARALDFLVCGAINEPHLPAGWFYSQSISLRTLCSEGSCHHRSSFVCPRSFATRDWLPVSELAECNEVKMWESVDFSVCAKNHVLFASDGSGRSRKIPQSLRQVAFGVATFGMHIGNDTSFSLQQTGYLGGQVPGKQTVPRAELWANS